MARAIEAVRAAIEPETDLHASADYRRQLAGALAGRALATALQRAGAT
jgi:carbon-monoxide dehydrogenase medium subunit